MSSTFLRAPAVTAPLDPGFRPAVLANRAFNEAAGPGAERASIAVEQADGSVFHFSMPLLPAEHAQASSNFYHAERFMKFLLWSRGGFRAHWAGPDEIGKRLQAHYRETRAGKFDAEIMGEKIYGRPFEVVLTKQLPAARAATTALGRHLEGCRIGFDLGASDRKAAAVIDGKVVFSQETVWSPVGQTDPQWHFDQIMDSLRAAAAHLPRVDAIGGSSAGVYVNNSVRVASLFRGVPPALFETRVKSLFGDLKKAWGDIPFEIVNDGEVTALAGSMAMGRNSVLGIAMGSSQAGGFVTAEGNITSWLNEFAFAPVDFNPDAPLDDWSGDRGCGALYFSQQCLARLMPAAGIETEREMTLPQKLEMTQDLMKKGDPRAEKIYRTVGVYLGYGVAHYADFYDFENALVLGRVTTGQGGEIILDTAMEVLKAEFPKLAAAIRFRVPDEKEKRHGQAIAAASLPALT